MSEQKNSRSEDRTKTVFRIERTYRPIASVGKPTPPQGGTGTVAKPADGGGSERGEKSRREPS